MKNLLSGLTNRGWTGRGRGHASWIAPAPEHRGTSVQVCGLWPFSAGSGTPMTGVPLGRHLQTGATVCGDPVSWFLAQLILNPSAFVIGRPGLGKSSLIRHMIGVMPAWGITPMVLSDLKPDHVRVVERSGGQVIRLGRGGDAINPLDRGPGSHELARIEDPAQRRAAEEELNGRRMNLLIGLCELARGGTLADYEKSLLTATVRLAEERAEGAPVIADLLSILERGHEEPTLQSIAHDRGEVTRYQDRTEALLDSLLTLGETGPFGDIFARETTVSMALDRPVCFDISAVDDGDITLQAALQLVCWSYGSSAVSCARYLAEAGLAPQRIYLMVMDELWRMLRASAVMVHRVDAITRLNRQRGLGQVMATHTMDDLRFPDPEITAMAWGFVERSAMVFIGGLAAREMGNLEEVFAMSDREKDMITGWADDGGFDPETGTAAVPPGRSHFLLKTGKKPGIPFVLELTPAELDVNDTNQAWHEIRSKRLGIFEESTQ